MAQTATKRERLEARISPDQKAFFQRAADMSGQTLTDFIVDSLEAAAEATIRAREVIHLSTRDSELFVAALLNPPEPGATLRAAAEDYRAFMRK